MLKYLILLVCFAGTATAQIPIVPPAEYCGTLNPIGADEPEPEEPDAPWEYYSLSGYFSPTICEEYTYAGWEETMQLQLGEGAEPYRGLIELAVQTWNDAVLKLWDEPLIEIIDDEPDTFQLPPEFWENRVEESLENLEDGESVIYFSPSPDDLGSPRGFARIRYSVHRMKAVDLYINTAHEEEWSGYTLAYTKKILEAGSSHRVYAFINSTYEVILHEIGHAVGLGHPSAAGNVMAPGTFIDSVADQWAPAMNLYQISQARGTIGAFDIGDIFVTRNNLYPYMAIRESSRTLNTLTDFYTERAKLGAAEKMLLNCVYEPK